MKIASLIIRASLAFILASPAYAGAGAGQPTPSSIGALSAANNLSDVASAATSRTNLGLRIGVDVQAYTGLTITTSTGTLTIANGSTLATSGAFSGTITLTAATNVTLPTSGTLVGSADTGTVTATMLASNAVTTAKITANAVDLTSKVTGVLPSTNGGNGSLPAFNAHLSANQTGVVSGTLTKFTANVMDWNVGSYFDTTGIKFTPPAGKYHFTVGVSWATPNAGPTFGYIYKNGTFSHRALFANAGGTIVGGCDEIANGTDYFECYFQQLSGVPLDIDSSLSGALSWWSAFRISN